MFFRINRRNEVRDRNVSKNPHNSAAIMDGPPALKLNHPLSPTFASPPGFPSSSLWGLNASRIRPILKRRSSSCARKLLPERDVNSTTRQPHISGHGPVPTPGRRRLTLRIWLLGNASRRATTSAGRAKEASAISLRTPSIETGGLWGWSPVCDSGSRERARDACFSLGVRTPPAASLPGAATRCRSSFKWP